MPNLHTLAGCQFWPFKARKSEKERFFAYLCKMYLLMFTSMIVFHLGVMPFAMIDSPAAYKISLNQVYAAIMMGSFMVFVEGLVHTLSAWVWFLFGTLFFGTLLAIRNQWGITDKQYLLDMIPHHSMAVLTSKHVLSRPSTVHPLAKQILEAQQKEIELMKSMLA